MASQSEAVAHNVVAPIEVAVVQALPPELVALALGKQDVFAHNPAVPRFSCLRQVVVPADKHSIYVVELAVAVPVAVLNTASPPVAVQSNASAVALQVA